MPWFLLASSVPVEDHLLHVEAELRAEGAPTEALDRLHDYAMAGEFPRNDGAGTLPIFHDEQGTWCAVGQLVVESDPELALRVAAEENESQLLDMEVEGLDEWIATSGFTAEQLAWIQPDYVPWKLKGEMLALHLALGIQTEGGGGGARLYDAEPDGLLSQCVLRANAAAGEPRPHGGHVVIKLISTNPELIAVRMTLTSEEKPTAEWKAVAEPCVFEGLKEAGYEQREAGFRTTKAIVLWPAPEV